MGLKSYYFYGYLVLYLTIHDFLKKWAGGLLTNIQNIV